MLPCRVLGRALPWATRWRAVRAIIGELRVGHLARHRHHHRQEQPTTGAYSTGATYAKNSYAPLAGCSVYRIYLSIYLSIYPSMYLSILYL